MVSLVTWCHFQFPCSHFTDRRPFSFILQLLRCKNLHKVVSLSELCCEDSETNSVGFFSYLPISAPGMPGESFESADGFFLILPNITPLLDWIRGSHLLASAFSNIMLSIYCVSLPQGLEFILPYWSSTSWHVNKLGFPT